MTFRQLCFGIITSIITYNTCYSSTIISGLPDASAQPFPFDLGKFYYNTQTRAFFVGANNTPPTDYQTMSVSFAGPTDTAFTGITPEKVMLNDVADQTNPLFGAAIEQLSFVEKSPIVVTQTQKNILHLVKYYTASSSMHVYASTPVLDANGATSQGIIALDGRPDNNLFGFIALPATGAFGDSGSILWVSQFASIKDPLDPQKTKLAFIFGLNSRIEKSTPAIKIGANLASIGGSAALHLAECFVPFADEEAVKSMPFNFYTGITAIGGANPTDGVRGVMLNTGVPITPDTALEANSIIGGIGPNTEVHINFVSSLYTSTQTRYLIIVGGVGTATETEKSVYALPITLSGTLAKKTALPVNVYTKSNHLWYRYFADTATTAGDLYSPNTISDIHRARVGGNGSLPGPIASLFAYKDAVFVTVKEADIPELAGVFHSQAIFDATGCIQGWTDWQPVNGLTTPTAACAIDYTNGNTWGAVYDSHDVLNTIVRTSWSQNSEFAMSFTSLFADQKPGAQCFIDFPHQYAAFSQIIGNRISLIVAGGYNRVALVQSGADTQLTGYFTPTTTFTHTHQSTDGSIGAFAANTDSMVISGGMLSSLGGIVTSDIVSDGTYSWLVVGGNGGLAILARPDGSGWATGSLGVNFVGLPTDAAFKIIGNFKNVRKIVADGANLYILTETECRRFAVSQAAIAGAMADQQIGTLLTSSNLLSNLFGTSAQLSDLIVSGPVALIGTSKGLIRVGNGRSIATDDYTNLDWQIITLPESVGPVTRFYAISPTGMRNEWATDACGGNIYVLAGYVGKSQSRVYRLAITGLTTTISDDTVTLFADHFIKDKNPSFFVSRGDYRNNIAYDGVQFYFMRSHFHPYPPLEGQALAEAMGPMLRTGVGFVEQSAIKIIAATGITMGAGILRSAQGSIMTGGSNMYTND